VWFLLFWFFLVFFFFFFSLFFHAPSRTFLNFSSLGIVHFSWIFCSFYSCFFQAPFLLHVFPYGTVSMVFPDAPLDEISKMSRQFVVPRVSGRTRIPLKRASHPSSFLPHCPFLGSGFGAPTLGFERPVPSFPMVLLSLMSYGRPSPPPQHTSAVHPLPFFRAVPPFHRFSSYFIGALRTTLRFTTPPFPLGSRPPMVGQSPVKPFR